MVRQFKIIVEKHPDGYVACPLGLRYWKASLEPKISRTEDFKKKEILIGRRID